MEILIKTLQFFLSISILVLLHEMGHYLFARLFKIRVEKFYLFFDPWFSLFKFKKGDTEYGIGWLPLGGYCKISGMIDESMDTEQMKQPAQPYEFRSKSTWQRLLVMIGGVLVNFILALFIYAAVLYAWGDDYLPNRNMTYGIAVDSTANAAGLRNGDKIIKVDGTEIDDFSEVKLRIILDEAKTVTVLRNGQESDIQLPAKLASNLIKNKNTFITVRIPFYVADFVKNSPAKEAGMQIGDRIVKINGDSTLYFDEFKEKIVQLKNQNVTITVDRNGQAVDLNVKVSEAGMIGVAPQGDLKKYFELKHVDYSFFAAIPAGISKGMSTVNDYLKQFKFIFSKETKGYEQLGGFLTIGSIFPGTWDWFAFWNMTAFLSIILAVMNILPIPALDGGHVLFLLYEIVTRRKPSEKFMEYAQIVGMVLVFGLVIYANLNDIIRFLF
jgi:regulator of sigma E protease